MIAGDVVGEPIGGERLVNDQLAALVDVGKSGTRWRGPGAVGRGPGVAPGTSGSADAAFLVAAGILSAWETAGSPKIDALVVGTTALPVGRELAALGNLLSGRLGGVPVLVFEDGVVAHAETLGAPGVVASVGTGTVVVGLGTDGRVVRADGWGPDLGDRGSAWGLGLAGARAAARAVDGVGPATALVEAAERLLLAGPWEHDSVAALLADPSRVARTAQLAVVVVDLAASDPVAAGLVAETAAEVALTCRATARRVASTQVALTGRFAALPRVRAAIHRDLAAHGLILVPALPDDPARICGILAAAPYRAAAALDHVP